MTFISEGLFFSIWKETSLGNAGLAAATRPRGAGVGSVNQRGGCCNQEILSFSRRAVLEPEPGP